MSSQMTESPRPAAGTAGDALLVVDDVTLRFGGVVVLNQVAFEIRRGEILGLIGPNGAGKTTCFNVMTGVYTPTSGEIRFDGTKISGGKPHKINALGIARTFQNIRLFPEMTAMENVMVGADARHKTSVMGALFRLYRVRPKESELPDNAIEGAQRVEKCTAQGRRRIGEVSAEADPPLKACQHGACEA